MKKFIFLTAEGFTLAPDDNGGVDNCQELGTGEGQDFKSALKTFLEEHPWVKRLGFDPAEIFGYEIGQRYN